MPVRFFMPKLLRRSDNNPCASTAKASFFSTKIRLTDIAADVQGTLSLLINDKTLPLNNGLLKLEINASQINIKSTVDMQDIEMDVAAFTQLYFGQFSVQELAAENRLKIHNQEAASLLDNVPCTSAAMSVSCKSA